MESMDCLSEPLALFLENLLEDASTVRVVTDNFRGLREEDAASYMPPPFSARISSNTAPLPELCRWGNSSSSSQREMINLRAADDLERITGCPSSPPSAAPKVPTRRMSFESDDECEEYWGDGDVQTENTNEDYDDHQSSSSSLPYSSIEIPPTPMAWEAKFAALQDSIDNLIDCKDNRSSPPKAPQRQSSVRLLGCGNVLPSNQSLSDQDQLLESADIQTVAKRRYGVSFLASRTDPLSSMLTTEIESPTMVLEKIDREICIREEKEAELRVGNHDVDDSPMFTKPKLDSLPCCARRRPSPQLNKLASFSSDDSISSVGANKRRPSLKLDKTACEAGSIGSAPVRAKRRPSPECETYSSLVEVLAAASSALVEEEADWPTLIPKGEFI